MAKEAAVPAPAEVQIVLRTMVPVLDGMGIEEIELVHRALEDDPKSSWTLAATAVAEDGRVACEADLVYRFRQPR